MKRSEKVKLDVVKSPPPGLKFLDSLGRRGVSVYVAKLTEALNCDGYVVIMAADAYMKNQLKMAATKLKLRLTYALDGDKLWIRPMQVDGEMKRLVLLLREARPLADLESKGLQIDLRGSLAMLAKAGTAHEIKGKWVLTEKGMDLL